MASLDEGFWPYLVPVRKAAWLTAVLCVAASLFFAMLFAGSPDRLETMLSRPGMRAMFGVFISGISGVGVLGGLLIHILGMRSIWRANRVRQRVLPTRMQVRIYFGAASGQALPVWMAELAPVDGTSVVLSLEVQDPPGRRGRWDGFHGVADVYQERDVMVIETEYGLLMRKQ
ncbi:MAG: hypothetical protein BWY76_00207 [bacterium ADurb.Bin429]|nr:MAG: hypothetical protein BWY76_00207 [bacterium ADurb.Bin429]